MRKHLAVAASEGIPNRADVCAAVRTELQNLGENFDPWDGPLEALLIGEYNAASKRPKAARAGIRWLEAATNEDGDRIDAPPEQLTLFQARVALDRRVASHDADGVWVARWQRVLAIAEKELARQSLDPRTATLGQLIGTEAITKCLSGAEEAAAA
jgi:hypothetical protein